MIQLSLLMGSTSGDHEGVKVSSPALWSRLVLVIKTVIDKDLAETAQLFQARFVPIVFYSKIDQLERPFERECEGALISPLPVHRTLYFASNVCHLLKETELKPPAVVEGFVVNSHRTTSLCTIAVILSRVSGSSMPHILFS